jgi:pectinesterase
MNKNKLPVSVLLTLALLLQLGCCVRAGEIQTGIQYGRAADANLLLDACVPDGQGPFPMAVIVHGGGWTGGDRKHDITLLFKPLIDANFTWFSIDYRLAPKYRWPACLEDVQTAVRWAKVHAAEFKGDPSRIALVGYSAGGHLVCMAAAIAEKDTAVQAVVGLAPPTDLVLDTLRRNGLSESLEGLFGRKEIDAEVLKLLWDASPINYLKPNLPPFLLVHGTADTSVPYQQSLNFRERCRALGVECHLVTVEGAPHRISAWTIYDSSYKQQIIDWLTKTIGNKSESPGQAADADNLAVITVSPDSSGDFATVQAAVDSVPHGNTKPVTIHIKPGTYKERIVVPPDKPFIHFVGDDAEKTILTFDMNARMLGEDGKEIGTFRTPSVTIEADDFSADSITFENSAGPVGQALATTVIGDRVVFRNCRFLGWQDTLLDRTGRHYYENCYITGHVDFIFGGGTAWFEKCHIHCLRKGYITAAATPEYQPYGYVFSNCTITGEPDVKTYLGRPWRDYAAVIFLNTEMSEVVRPEGWNNWRKPYREKTARYAEFNSTGPGADPQARVPWARQLTTEQAKAVTIESVLGGRDGWNPLTGQVRLRLQITPALPADVESLKKKLTDGTRDGSAYLFSAFRGDGADGLYLLCSSDGFIWQKLGASLLKPQVGTANLLQNPSILSGPDGRFHLVWSTGARGDQGLGYAQSQDLIDWSQQKFVDLMGEQKALDVTSPQLFYDDARRQFVITWASTLPNNYYQAFQEPEQDNPRLWYTTTSDFETFAPDKLFFEPGCSVADGLIIRYGKRYALLHEDYRTVMKTLRVAFADSPVGPWGPSSDSFTPRFSHNPAVLNVGNEFVLYFEKTQSGTRGALMTTDFNEWKDITDFVSFPEGYHGGNILKVQSAVLEKLKTRNDI